MAPKLHLISILALLAIASAQHVDFYEEMSYLASLTDIPTDPNFNVSTFIGDWNVVGAYGFGLSPRSCPTVNVKKTVTTSLAITMTSVNVKTSTYSVLSKTYQPSPLNKAILIDILTTTNRQNVAVSFYNDTLGQAILINMNSLFAVALSKSDNIYTNMFLETVNDIFIEAGLPLNQTVLTDQFGCSTNYTVAPDFNAKSFPGTYYGNAVFTLSPALVNVSCFNVKVQKDENSNVYNVTRYLQYNDSLSNFSSNYIPSPSSPAFLLNIEDFEIPSLVVNYYLAADNLYVLLANDGSYALIVSNKQTLDASTITYIQGILTKEGLTVNDQTFFVTPKTCQVGNEDNNDFLSIIS